MNPNRSIASIGAIATAAALAAVASALPTEVQADTFKPYTVRATDVLNVRSTPGTQQPRIGQLKQGDTIEVIGIAGKSEQGQWLKVKYKGKTAYVDGAYTAKVQQAQKAQPAQAIQKVTSYQGVTTDRLNVRFLPSQTGTVLTTLNKGTTVTVTGKTADGWLQIDYKNGSAYVFADYIKKNNGPSQSSSLSVGSSSSLKVQYTGTTTDNLNVRNGASTTHKILTTLKKGSKVDVVGTSGSWLKIKYNGGTAYVSDEYVKKSGSSSTGSSSSSLKVQYTGTTTDNLNVRNGASTAHKILTTLKKGSKVDVVGTSGSWLKIKYNGGTAYVSGEYVKKSGSSSTGSSSSSLKVQYTGTTTDNLNVRNGASTTHKILTTLKKGSKVEVVGTSGSWLKIKYNGGTAYVSDEYVKKSGSASTGSSSSSLKVQYTGTTTDNLNVRNGASTAHKILTTLKKGSKVDVVGTSGSWLKIKYNGGTAYVSDEYVKKSGSSSTGSSSSSLKVQYTGTTTDNLNVRNGASTAHKILTTLKKGSKVEVVGTSGSWLKIKYNGGTAYVSGEYVKKDSSSSENGGSGGEEEEIGKKTQTIVTTDVHFRSGPSTQSSIIRTLKARTEVEKLADGPNGWVKVSYGGQDGYIYGEYVQTETTTTTKSGNSVYVTTKYPISFGKALSEEEKVSSSSSSELAYYLNPKNFAKDSAAYLQFLKLSSVSGASVNELNAMLKGRGVLSGHGADFIEAAKKYGVNEIYLVSHALLETGNGTSKLATGYYKYNGKKVYNMFGIGAFDGSAGLSGSQYAYNHGWTSVQKAILGGTAWIATNYIYNATYMQDTLYKMRWNPDALVSGNAAHQYATAPSWAVSQTDDINYLYGMAKIKNLIFDVPDYSD
ncbi:MAG: SH3 domain-containing protein [Sporolactobacillus sp.]|nr:SH3 domain-containing protein [Sporolactobacillus sp.]